MKALIQRVSRASVAIDGWQTASIERGLLVLLGVEKGDDEAATKKLCERVLSYRVFADDSGRMNCDLLDVAGELLVVSQFTLAADTRKGRRPSFSSAAPPDEGERLYQLFVAMASERLSGSVHTGTFGADMQVELVNDGPVTFLLEV